MPLKTHYTIDGKYAKLRLMQYGSPDCARLTAGEDGEGEKRRCFLSPSDLRDLAQACIAMAKDLEAEAMTTPSSGEGHSGSLQTLVGLGRPIPHPDTWTTPPEPTYTPADLEEIDRRIANLCATCSGIGCGDCCPQLNHP